MNSPQYLLMKHLIYHINIFRVIIINFMDAYDFDVRSVKKSCVHIVHKDGRMIPFETMNLFYRDEKEIYLNKLIKGQEEKFDYV